MPPEFSTCDFSKETCWGAGLSTALADFGFAIVRAFIPEYMVAPARAAVEENFGRVLRSFTHGHMVERLADVNKIPPFAWTKVLSRDPPSYVMRP